MVKYLTKKGFTFWYRRRLGRNKEIIFSLGTKNYDLALLRHSYIDYKIQEHIIKGNLKIMDIDKINNIIKKYKKFMKSDEFIYGKEGKIRDDSLAIKTAGKFYAGHSKPALLNKLNQYHEIMISSSDDNIEKLQEQSIAIITRNNTLLKAFNSLETTEDKVYFHWLVLKAEIWGLNKSIKKQDKYFEAVEQQHIEITSKQSIKNNEKSISISELTKKYIEEKSKTKGWGGKNEEDILYVLDAFDEYFSPKTANELIRNDFVKFRDDVLSLFPKSKKLKALKDKSTIEITKMTNIPPEEGSKAKPKEILRISKVTVNKHMGRISQVFTWAKEEASIIDKNYALKLRYTNVKTAEEKKKSKTPFNTQDLKQWFEVSPNFTSKLKTTLTKNPEYIFIPLISLYLGARNAELTQLHYRDIKKINDIWSINITDFAGDPNERKRTKNENSRRTLPIADALIDIGFLKYVQTRKNKLLFPSVVYYGKSEEPSFTSRISEYIIKYIKQPDEKKTFLSFRHMVNQKLKNTKTELYIINDITGHNDTNHGDNNIDVDTYGDEQMPLAILQETINKSLVYDEIDFSHIKDEIHRRYK